MRSRAMLAAAVLGSALVSGGWLVERGLIGGTPVAAGGGRLFDQVYQHISREYVDTLSDSTLYVRAVDGLVSELHDPHSNYLSPELLARLSERTSGKYAGVGASIDVRDGWLTIVAPLPGGPALAAGIHSGDRISEVDGVPMHGKTVEEAQKVLRGNPGSVVKLTVTRPGVAGPLKFALTRSEIHVRSVQHAMVLRDGVGYVALTIFSEQSVPELRAAIDSLRATGMRSLIFDLRGDPGGLLDQGVGVSDLFLNVGVKIVTMRGRGPTSNVVFGDRAIQPWPSMPLAVLVDSNSASAAEIVAGALQDHDRALLLGTATYGKGSAQNVFPLPNGGAVKLTTALWYTPSGRSINRKRPAPGETDSVSKKPAPTFTTDAGRVVRGGGGITPDVLLPAPALATGDTTFERALGKYLPQFRDALTDYALSIKATRAVPSAAFAVTPAMRAELLRRMLARGAVMDARVYDGAHALIDRLLSYEIARYSFSESAEWSRRLGDDRVVAAALALMAGVTTQQELLQRGAAKPR
jgi:carboxyl-terminal processing protease